MPADVKFEQAAEEPIIQDQATIAAAKAGPDIYCAYCGTRNASTAKVCKQCNAPLSEGTAREAGGVVGALRDKPAPPQKCPSCGAENQASALKCIRCGAPLGKAVPAAAQTTPPSSPGRFGLVPLVLIGVVIVPRDRRAHLARRPPLQLGRARSPTTAGGERSRCSSLRR